MPAPAGSVAAYMLHVVWKSIRTDHPTYIAEAAEVGNCIGSVVLIIREGEPKPYLVKCLVRRSGTVLLKIEQPYVHLNAAVRRHQALRERATELLTDCQ